MDFGSQWRSSRETVQETAQETARKTVRETAEEAQAEETAGESVQENESIPPRLLARHFHLRHTHFGKGRPTSGGS